MRRTVPGFVLAVLAFAAMQAQQPPAVVDPAVAAARERLARETAEDGVREPWRTAPMPPVNASLLDGDLAWRQHDGGHTDAPNRKHFIAWASRP